MTDTPRCNALESNPLDSFDHRAWMKLARDLERELIWASGEKAKLTEIVAARPEEAPTPTPAQEEVRELILAERAKGNLVVLGIEGLMSMALEDFVKQPADGMLYDLNRGEEISLTFLHERKWVNDFAVALVIRKLKAMADSHLPQGDRT